MVFEFKDLLANFMLGPWIGAKLVCQRFPGSLFRSNVIGAIWVPLYGFGEVLGRL